MGLFFDEPERKGDHRIWTLKHAKKKKKKKKKKKSRVLLNEH